MRRSAQITGVVILILLLVTTGIWYAAIREDRGGLLTVSFLDIGQGDSIFIDAPSGRRVLIDGGPDASVLRRLGEIMPFYDRSIDVVIGTHPDSDHIAGLIDVLQRYDVSYIVQSPVLGTTPTWHSFEDAIAADKKKGTKVITAKRGEVIDLGDGAYLEVLSPDRTLLHTDTNTACVVTRLVYGSTSFMLPCDAPQDIEKYLVELDGSALRSSVLKAGHHGSKTASSPLFVGEVDPQYAVYSRGCDNEYGFPDQETIDTFARFGVPTLDTCKDGTVTFVSDGQTVSRE
jgi:competence protein ComEC